MKKILFSILYFSLIGTLTAQTPSISFDHVALSVSDVNASVTFYEAVFQLDEITNRTEKPGIRWMGLGEGKELHLISTVEKPFQVNKAIHFALSVKDFDGFMERLQTQKIPYWNWAETPNEITVRADGIRQVYVRDPDGHWIEVNSSE